MLGTIGDLVEDVVVHLASPLAQGSIHIGSDTAVVVHRRRGGSAANVAAAAARAGGAARYIGQVGADALGDALVGALRIEGVDVVVRRAGRSGSVIALVDPDGERTMLADPATCRDLDGVDATWLDGLHTLHVPAYSLTDGPLATTAIDLIDLAHDRSVRVSVDASSVSLIEAYGVERLLTLLDRIRPDVMLCNADEADCFGAALVDRRIAAGLIVVKRGPHPATVLDHGGAVCEVPVPPVGRVTDTTGAGDAFAAGFLLALAAGRSAPEAVGAGHRSAATAIGGRARAAHGGGPDDRTMP